MIEPKTSSLFVLWLVWLGVSFMPVVETRHVKQQMARAAGAEQPAAVLAQQEVQILQDHIAMIWIITGAIAGGYVCAAVKKIRLKQLQQTDPSLTTRLGAVVYASVGTFISIFASPWVVKRYMNPGVNGNGIESIPFVSLLIALTSWFVLELGEILYTRVRDRTKKDGLAGLKDELTGQIRITQPEPAPVREEKPKP